MNHANQPPTTDAAQIPAGNIVRAKLAFDKYYLGFIKEIGFPWWVAALLCASSIPGTMYGIYMMISWQAHIPMVGCFLYFFVIYGVIGVAGGLITLLIWAGLSRFGVPDNKVSLIIGLVFAGIIGCFVCPVSGATEAWIGLIYFFIFPALIGGTVALLAVPYSKLLFNRRATRLLMGLAMPFTLTCMLQVAIDAHQSFKCGKWHSVNLTKSDIANEMAHHFYIVGAPVEQFRGSRS